MENYDPSAYEITDPVYMLSPQGIVSTNDPSNNYRVLIEAKVLAGEISLPVVKFPLLLGDKNRSRGVTSDDMSDEDDMNQ